MSRRTLSVLALSVVLLPVSFVGLLVSNALRQRDIELALDPFEIDLQLYDRNDELV